MVDKVAMVVYSILNIVFLFFLDAQISKFYVDLFGAFIIVSLILLSIRSLYFIAKEYKPYFKSVA